MPRTKAIIATLSLATAAAAPATPLTESVALPPNAGGQSWHVISSHPGAVGTNQEWVPDGQSERLWREMITVRGYKPDTNVPQLVTKEVQLFANVCKSYSIVETHKGTGRAIPAHIDGRRYEYPNFDLLARCDEPARMDTGLRRYEVIWFKGLKGEKAYFLVQRAWHGDETGPDTVLGSEKVHDEWHNWIDSIGLNADVPVPAR
jgi:hypothetical protein